jgi:hypothetical protein
MRKQLVLAAVAALAPACLAAQQAGWLSVPGSNPVLMRSNPLDGQSGPVVNKPFSATEVRHTQQVLADGTHVDHNDTSVFYRDDRGRMRTGNDTVALIYDPVGGFTYSLNVKEKTYKKTPVRSGDQNYSIAVAKNRTSTSSWSGNSHATPRARTQGSTTLTEDLPQQFIDGVRAKGSRVTVTIPAGTFGNDRDVKVVNERWYSDDLQVLLRSSNSDPRFGVTTYEVTDMLQGPPDPSLFVMPADYRLEPESTSSPYHPHPPLH